MKACVLKAVGDLQYCEIPKPQPKENEVLLKVMACGICSSDIDRVFKTGTYHFPTVPGHEFAGQIVELGEGVDPSLLGKRAAVFPLLPCFECPSCKEEKYACCSNYNYFGSRCDGAFAEYLAVPVWNLVCFPDSVPYTSAALCEPTAVALHAVKEADIHPGDTVVIVGSGTIGLLAALWARVKKAGQVVIVGRTEEKLKAAKALGFDHVVASANEDPVQTVAELTGGAMADAVLELVGTSQAISTSICCCKKGGTVVLTGNPASDITLERNVYWKILRNELKLRGTWNSMYGSQINDWKDALVQIADTSFPVEKLITHRFPLSEHEKAFSVLRDRKECAVKVMFEIGG